MPPTILITIDVEDWFQVENLRKWNPPSSWDSLQLRVEHNLHRLLDLFDETDDRRQKTEGRDKKPGDREQKTENLYTNTINPTNTINSTNSINKSNKAGNKQLTAVCKLRKKVSATFFVLGWIAERLPYLVREIHARGHEVASHGYNHNLCNQLSSSELQNDLTDSKKLLEDIIGSKVLGFRAPNFSINDDILKIIEDCGHLYDSSYNSFNMHGRYGMISLNGVDKKGIAHRISESFFELPISNLQLKNFVFPFGGGAYFRLYPFSFFSLGVKAMLRENDAYLIYLHPWEIDPDQPRVREASLNFKLRHYSNLSKTYDRLKKLIRAFSQCRFSTCNQYLADLV